MRKFTLTGPTFLASGPCGDPWGLGNTPGTSPLGHGGPGLLRQTPAVLAGFTSPGVHTLGSGYFWGGWEGWLWGTSVPLQLVHVLLRDTQWESLSQGTASDGLDLRGTDRKSVV